MSLDVLCGAHPGETCWIVGKGPSLRFLRAEHIGEGPVIVLNDAIVKVEALGLDNPLYSLQKDGREEFMVKPGNDVTLILQDTPGFSQDWYPEHHKRVLVEPIEELGFDHVTVMAVRMAIEIARKMGCLFVNLVSCDSLVSNEYRTYDVRANKARKTEAAHFYQLAKSYVLDDLKSIRHNFITPRVG